jgi:hypothetical protein
MTNGLWKRNKLTFIILQPLLFVPLLPFAEYICHLAHEVSIFYDITFNVPLQFPKTDLHFNASEAATLPLWKEGHHVFTQAAVWLPHVQSCSDLRIEKWQVHTHLHCCQDSILPLWVFFFCLSHWKFNDINITLFMFVLCVSITLDVMYTTVVSKADRIDVERT